MTPLNEMETSPSSPSSSLSWPNPNQDPHDQSTQGATPRERRRRKHRHGRGSSEIYRMQSIKTAVILVFIATCPLWSSTARSSPFAEARQAAAAGPPAFSSLAATSELSHHLRGTRGKEQFGGIVLRILADAYDEDDDYVPPSEGAPAALAAANVTATGAGVGTAAAATAETTPKEDAVVSAEATTTTATTTAKETSVPAAAAAATASESLASGMESQSQATESAVAATVKAATTAAPATTMKVAEETSENLANAAGENENDSGATTEAMSEFGSANSPNNTTAGVAAPVPVPVPAPVPMPENAINSPDEISPQNDSSEGESIPAPLPIPAPVISATTVESAPSPPTTVASNSVTNNVDAAVGENTGDKDINESITAAPIVPALAPIDSTEEEDDDDYVPIQTANANADEKSPETTQNNPTSTFAQQELDAETLVDEINTIESEIQSIEMENDDDSITDDAVYEAKQEEELQELEELEKEEEVLIKEGLEEGLLEYVDDQYGAEYGYDDDQVEALDTEIEEIEEQIEELELEDDDGASYSVKEEEEEELKELEEELVEEELVVLGLEREEDDYFNEEGLEDDDDDVDGGLDDYNNNVANVDDDVVTIDVGDVNTTSGSEGNANNEEGGPIIDPVITMDLTQYNKDANGTLSLVSNVTAPVTNVSVENANDSASEQTQAQVGHSEGTEGERTADDDDDDVAATQSNPSETEENSAVGDGDDDDAIKSNVAASATETSTGTTIKPCQDDIYYRYEGDQTKDCNTFIASQEDADKREKRCNKDSGIVDENTDAALLVGDFCKLSCGKCDASPTISGVDGGDSTARINGNDEGTPNDGGADKTLPSTAGANVTDAAATGTESSAGGGETNESTSSVADASSVPSNATNTTENEGSTGQQYTTAGSNATETVDSTQPPSSGNIEGGGANDDVDDEGITTSPPKPVPEPVPQSISSPSKAPFTLVPTSTITSHPTRKPTEKPTYEYVETTDDDPVASEEEIIENEAFQNGEEVPHTEETNIPAASESAAGENGDESHESILEEEEEELKKVGGWMTVAAVALMVFTAYQMSENPDGVCASLCRLAITVIGCIVKIILIPFKYVLGGGRPSGGHYMATPDYRDPYGSRHMELT